MALTPEGTPYVESTDLVANYPAASLSLANRVDLVGVIPFANAAARTTAIPTPTDGQFTYLQDTNSTEFYNGSAFEALGGKILQVVRATDTTNRSTTSLTYVDVTGMSVTITPQKSTSVILIISAYILRNFGTNNAGGGAIITDSSNNTISGAEGTNINFSVGNSTDIRTPQTLIGYATPATTSAVTYKLRFRREVGTTEIRNDWNTGQLFAIEVSA